MTDKWPVNAARGSGAGRGGAARCKGSDLDDYGVALASAGADRGDAEPAAATTELVDERTDYARAGGADRVTEGDRAAVDVDVLLIDAEHPHRVERDRGEGLVDLPDVNVLGALADLLPVSYTHLTLPTIYSV